MNLLQTLFLAGTLAAWSRMEARAQAIADTSEHHIFGTIDSLTGSRLVVRTRTGTFLHVDALPALTAYRSGVLFVRRVVEVVGTKDTAGVLHAKTIARVKDSTYPALWPPDR